MNEKFYCIEYKFSKNSFHWLIGCKNLFFYYFGGKTVLNKKYIFVKN
jgi:hypothetical protein